MSDIKIAKIKSDYDPDCVLTLIKNHDGDIIVALNKMAEPDGTGEFRITMSGGQFQGVEKTKIVGFFEKIIDAFIEKEKKAECKKQLDKKNIDNILKEIGDRMETYRRIRNLTQQELAYKMGCDRTTITNYEAGRTMMPVQKLYELADILEVDLYNLLP